MEELRIEMDSVKKYTNKNEYHTVPRVRALEEEVMGNGEIVRKLCSILIEKNPQINPLVYVFRGNTLCFIPKPLKSWLEEGAVKKGEQPEQFKKK